MSTVYKEVPQSTPPEQEQIEAQKDEVQQPVQPPLLVAPPHNSLEAVLRLCPSAEFDE
jgi:hypothetical protein